MKTSDFNYTLPQELIAQHPLESRSASRLLVMDKNDGSLEHKCFEDIIDYLNPGDCLVLNDTKVIPARIIGQKEMSGGQIEFVLLKRRFVDPVSDHLIHNNINQVIDNVMHDIIDRVIDNVWEVILKPGRKAKIGARFVFGNGILKAEILEIIEGGNRLVRFEYDGVFEEILDKIGTMPLPPYITEKLVDQQRYQTVYALNNGSAAAPTAGLHFTPELLKKLSKKGVILAYLTLHVGLGTFRPVNAVELADHLMHSEHYVISNDTAQTINTCKQNGKRIISVGTTSTRVLESVADENGFVTAREGDTTIFIFPGYKFKCVDALITNFHLPESTLIMLVSAFSNRENVLNAYHQAVEQSYRFFSFGDAMLIR